MADRNLVQALFLIVIGLFFGLGALRYPLGSLAQAGPGLFPLMVGTLVVILAVVVLVRSRLAQPVPLEFNVKNIVLIMLALGAFVLASEHISVLVGIVLLVFIADLASTTYSWRRDVVVSLALIAIAFAFQRFLGLNLRLL